MNALEHLPVIVACIHAGNSSSPFFMPLQQSIQNNNLTRPSFVLKPNKDARFDYDVEPWTCDLFPQLSQTIQGHIVVFDENLTAQYLWPKCERGVAAFDLDGCTVCFDTVPVVKYMRKCHDEGYFCVIITARTLPMNIPYEFLQFISVIYYNRLNQNIPETKVRQLRHAHTNIGLPESMFAASFLVDDSPENLSVVISAGFTGIHRTCAMWRL
jgi:hypothetical protein